MWSSEKVKILSRCKSKVAPNMSGRADGNRKQRGFRALTAISVRRRNGTIYGK